MSVDILQEKIRRTKNPTILELNLAPDQLPAAFEQNAAGYGEFCRELLESLKGFLPGVRVSFSSFALLGAEGLTQLSYTMKTAASLGFYVILDGPEMFSPAGAEQLASCIFGENSQFPCDALVISGYMGSDGIKPFLPYVKQGKKDLFVVARSANKSASEIQDLLAGSRVVHAAVADHVNRYGADTAGKFGYTRVGILGAASSADSLRSLRAKYPKLFFLVDGYDYPNANAKNCSFAFDKFGHGAVVCSGLGITCAWNQSENAAESDWLECAHSAAERMKKNLTRYITIM